MVYFQLAEKWVMAEQHKKVWFRRSRWGIWPAHWKGWALALTVFPIWLAWTLICAATGLILHPFVVLIPIGAYVVWLLIFMDRNARND